MRRQRCLGQRLALDLAPAACREGGAPDGSAVFRRAREPSCGRPAGAWVMVRGAPGLGESTASQGEPMNTHHKRIRTGLLAGTAAIAIGLVGSANAFATDCVVGPGVTQTTTTVTGSPMNDTIDCGGTTEGKTIVGLGGNDTITGRTSPTRSAAATATTRSPAAPTPTTSTAAWASTRSPAAPVTTRSSAPPTTEARTRSTAATTSTHVGYRRGSGHPRQLRERARTADHRSGLGHSEGGRALRGQRRPVHRPLPDRLQLPVRRRADQEAAARAGRAHLHGGRWDVASR